MRRRRRSFRRSRRSFRPRRRVMRGRVSRNTRRRRLGFRL